MKTDKKSTFVETVQTILSTKAVVSYLEPMCILETKELHCFTNMVEIEKVMNRDYPDVSNLKVGVISGNSRGQKLAIVIVREETVSKILLYCGKIKIGWSSCGIRLEGSSSLLFSALG